MTGQVHYLRGKVRAPKFAARVVNFIAGSIKPLQFMAQS